MRNIYKQISDEDYDILMSRHAVFSKNMASDVEPVRVFNPLSPQHLKELELIREVSKALQIKKEEDVNKAAQDAIEQKAAAEQKVEENKEVEKEDS